MSLPLLGLLLGLPLARASPSWLLTTHSLDQAAFQVQPYVANGYIGQRIPAEGFGYKQMTPINASAMDGTSGWPLFDPRFTSAIVAGFYDQQPNTTGTNFPQTGGEQPISTLPTWSSLYLTVDNATYEVGTPASEISAYTQSLSIQTGIVTTSLTWLPSSNTSNSSGIELTYTLLAHRTRPNIGLVRLDVSLPASHSSEVTVTDVLDGTGSWRTTPVSSGAYPHASGAGAIYTAVRPNGIANVTAYTLSQLSFLSGSGTPVNSTQGCYTGFSTSASTAAQCYRVKGGNGAKFSVVKLVSIASSDAYPHTLSSARAALVAASAIGYDKLVAEHTTAWDALWAESDIVIPSSSEDDLASQLQLATRASLFHLLSNVREGKEGPGLGDNSIAPGGLTSDSYAGQIFWDADTWMFPSLLALFPSYAESIVNFRYRQLGAAEENVRAYTSAGGRAAGGGELAGAAYPWMGARFGNCTGVGPCFNYEDHLENDISLAQYQYFASTQNTTWLRKRGWPVLSAIADFWVSQVVKGPTAGTYGTLNETDPDEYANFRNNAAYTNAGISVVFRNAILLASKLGITPPARWGAIGKGITVLQDPSSGVVLEYAGFNATTAVKQADVVLLTYPLEYNQSTTQGMNDLDFYALATSPNGPGMTYSVFSIDASTLSPVGCASYTYLLAASQPYSRAPYYQFSEQTTDAYATNGGTNPAFTFLTAHGGFLQSFTHGFTGYRSRTTAFYLDPVLPVQLPEYTIKGMRWADSVFDVTLTTSTTTIVRRSGSAARAPVEIGPSNAKAGSYSLKVGDKLVVPTRATKGTLVSGNIAQCKTISGTSDTSFTLATAPTIVPGQYALAAIDGSNATTWQPLSNSTANMTIDLGSSHPIHALHFNWNANPALEFAVYAGEDAGAMTSVAGGAVNVSAPYDAATAAAVSLKVGNLTDVVLQETVQARYVTVSITGSYLDDGRGATLAEVAVL